MVDSHHKRVVLARGWKGSVRSRKRRLRVCFVMLQELGLISAYQTLRATVERLDTVDAN